MGVSKIVAKSIGTVLKIFPHDYSTKIARFIRKELEPYKKEQGHFTSPRGNIYVSGVRRSLKMDNDLTQFEPETIRWIDNYIKPSDCVWDIGANVGLYSSYIVKVPDITLTSFEPHSATHTELFQNVIANNDTGNENIFPLNMALGDGEEIMQMPIDSHEPGYTSSTITKRIYEADHIAQPVLTMSGDMFSKTYKQKPTHIKLDVDGAELAILMGMKDVLKDVSTLLIEVEDDLLEQFDEVVAAHILPSGLRLCSIKAPECGRMKFFSRNEADVL